MFKITSPETPSANPQSTIHEDHDHDLDLDPTDTNTTSIPPTTPLTITITTSPSPISKYPSKPHCRLVASHLHRAGHLPTAPSLIYLPGTPSTLLEDSDFSLPIRQRRYFSYLSGVSNDMADCALVYDVQRDVLVLFIPDLDPRKVLWSGMPRGVQECYERYDVDDVRYSSSCAAYVLGWVEKNRVKNGGGDAVEGKSNKPVIYCLNENQIPQCLLAGKYGSRGDFIMEKKDGGGGKHEIWRIDTRLLKPCIDEARTIKDDFEIGLINKAIEISRQAHVALYKFLPTATNEAELEAVFIKECIARKAKSQSYDPIVCSGRNCAILHYTTNDADLKGKQLVLVDAACEWECYAADITRTWPISGKFTSEAGRVYRAVERMQRETIERSVAGVDWAETHVLAHKIAVEELLDMGILKGGTVEEILKAGTSRAFFPHGLGHMLGLEVHDVEGYADAPPSYQPPFSTGISTNKKETCSNSAPLINTLLPMHPTTTTSDYSLPLPQSLLPTTVIQRILKPNMVITVEPGIYFCEWIIRPYLRHLVHGQFIDSEVLERYWDVGGVRIEDVVLINEADKGNTVLSASVPRARV